MYSHEDTSHGVWWLGNDITYLVEIIYPENRIVVNYDFSGLVHITSLYTETGLVVPESDKAGLLPIRKVKRVYNKDLKTDRKSTRLNSSHSGESRMPSSA